MESRPNTGTRNASQLSLVWLTLTVGVTSSVSVVSEAWWTWSVRPTPGVTRRRQSAASWSLCSKKTPSCPTKSPSPGSCIIVMCCWYSVSNDLDIKFISCPVLKPCERRAFENTYQTIEVLGKAAIPILFLGLVTSSLKFSAVGYQQRLQLYGLWCHEPRN